MNDGGNLSVAIYNPDLLGRQELVAQFVARQPLLDRMVEDLREARPHHRLLVGQRGMGKSTLLRRLRFAVEDDCSLSGRWLPLSFPEEQYNVARLSDFWANCLDALSDALFAGGDEAASRALDARIDALPDGDEGERARVALELLRDCGKRSKRGFILLLDNLDLVLDRLSKAEHWTLRKALEASHFVLVGACVAPPESAFSHEGAFYDWFKVDELRPLSLDEARDVLLRLAKVRGAPHVEEVVRDDPGRVAALHQLTSGNPRTLTLLHDLLARDDVHSVERDLAGLLDQCTPLYKARFEALSQQQQQVLDALSLHWAPATAAQVAERTRLAVQTVSSQLDRLVKDGVVEKVPSDSPRQLFQVGERFFNIWYLMRASRRMRRKVLWLAEFLRGFYGDGGMRHRARSLSLLPLPELVDDRERHLALMMAFAQVIDDRGLRNALEAKATEAIVDTRELRARLAEILDLGGEDAHIGGKVDRLGVLRDLEAQVRAAKVRLRKGWEPGAFWRTLGGAASLTLEEKRRIVADLPTMEPAKLRALTVQLAAEEQRWQQGARTKKLPEAIRRGYMVSADDVEGATGAEPACGAELVDEAMARVLGAEPGAAELERVGLYLPHVTEPATWARWVSLALKAGASTQEFGKWVEQHGGEVEFWGALTDKVEQDVSTAMREPRSQDSARMVAVALIDSGLHQFPNDIELLRVKANIEQSMNRNSQAAATRRRITTLPDATAQDWYNHAKDEIFVRRDRAEAAMRRSLELDVGLWPARARLVSSLLARNEVPEALKVLAAGAPSPEVELIRSVALLQNATTRRDEFEGQVLRLLPGVFHLETLFMAWLRLDEARAAVRTAVARRIGKLARGVVCDLVMPEVWFLEGKDEEARHALVRLLNASETPQGEGLRMNLLRTFVRHGHAALASEVFDASPAAERQLPLQAALRILAFPDRYSIERLPAEVREPTRELIASLSDPFRADGEPVPGVPKSSSQRGASPPRPRRS